MSRSNCSNILPAGRRLLHACPPFLSFPSLYLAIILLSAGRASSQNVISGWFPVHPGDKWVYAHTSRDENGAGSAHLDLHAWQTEELVIASRTVPEGTLLENQVRIIEGSPPSGWRVNPNAVYLI